MPQPSPQGAFMIERIFIPTIRRADKQFTYENLPAELQARVVMVIDPAERHLYHYPCQYLELPPHIVGAWTQLAMTRKFIHQHAGRIKYAMIDDDLVFKKRNAKYWTGVADMPKSKREATPAEILRLFETASAWLDEDGIGIVGVSDDGVPPAKTEYSDTKGVFNCLFLDGNMIAEVIDDADTSIRVAEDVLFLFECLSKGINTRMANEFLATNKSLGKELKGRRPVWEGMFDQMPKDHFQTNEHYDALRHIADRFPEGMEIFEKGGRMKNKKSWKKVYRCRLAG